LGVLRDPMPKAFALSNGSIYLTAGSLARVDDEAQRGWRCAAPIWVVHRLREIRTWRAARQ
jgi:hypothetical protein